jgi:hypothetical protein
MNEPISGPGPLPAVVARCRHTLFPSLDRERAVDEFHPHLKRSGVHDRAGTGLRHIGYLRSYGKPNDDLRAVGGLLLLHGRHPLLHLSGEVRRNTQHPLHQHQLPAMVHLMLFAR